MTAAPVRIRLSRARGFNLQEHSRAINGLPAVKVDRSTHFGNPFKVGRDGTAADCVNFYRLLMAGAICLTAGPSIDDQQRHLHLITTAIDSLRGHNLACWCRPDKPCHADVLLTIANRKEPAP